MKTFKSSHKSFYVLIKLVKKAILTISVRIFGGCVRSFREFYLYSFRIVYIYLKCFLYKLLLWPRKESLMKTQTRMFDNRLYYSRKLELHRKGKKSRTVRITPIVTCLSGNEISVLITVRTVHYSKMCKVPTTPIPQAFYFVKVLVIFFSFLVDHQRVGEFPFPP